MFRSVIDIHHARIGDQLYPDFFGLYADCGQCCLNEVLAAAAIPFPFRFTACNQCRAAVIARNDGTQHELVLGNGTLQAGQ